GRRRYPHGVARAGGLEIYRLADAPAATPKQHCYPGGETVAAAIQPRKLSGWPHSQDSCATAYESLAVGGRPSSTSINANIVSISERAAKPASFLRRFKVSVIASFQPRFRMNSFQT